MWKYFCNDKGICTGNKLFQSTPHKSGSHTQREHHDFRVIRAAKQKENECTVHRYIQRDEKVSHLMLGCHSNI
jgi:hypothetical protein